MSASVEDRIQTELWRGAIPVEIHLAADEVADVAPPPPFFGLIPRGAYLPVWYDRETEPSPRRHFEPFVARFPDNVLTNQRNADAVGDEVAPSPDVAEPDTPSARADGKKNNQKPCWFDHDGAPLRWNVCAGTLHDVFARREADGTVASRPWRLTVHYAPCKEDEDDAARVFAGTGDSDGFSNAHGLFASGDESSARAHFFNALKEAVHVERGSAAVVMSMTRAAQRDLWRSVLTGDRSLATEAETALEVTARATEADVAANASADDKESLSHRRIPTRVFVRAGKDATERHASWRDVVWTSAPVPVYPHGLGSRKSTARDALALVAPQFLENESNDSLNDSWRCFVQGVEVSLDAPLDALHARMRGADRFLHVCAVRLNAKT